VNRVGCLVGPPGTGKTTAATRMTQRWMDRGVSSGQIAYLAFTRAAAKEAVTKIMGGEDRLSDEAIRENFPLFRTIHSLAFMGLKGLRPDAEVMTPAHMRQFSKENGYEGKMASPKWEDLSDAFQHTEHKGSESDWDQVLGAYMLSRVTARNENDLDGSRHYPGPEATKGPYVDAQRYRTFVAKYEAFKEREGIADFTDMLEFAARIMEPLDHVRYVVIDEAQDLASLHHLILNRCFRNAEFTWFVGDEDQCIYSFSGARASLFLNRYRTAHQRVVLRQTHRFGERVVQYSRRIIKRVRDRIVKNVVGLQGRHGSVRFRGRFEPCTGDTLVLHRHVAGCQEAARLFMEHGMPFRNERGHDPLSYTNRIQAWECLDELAAGKPTSPGAVKALLADVVPSNRVEKDGTKTKLIPHGAKKAIETRGVGQAPVTLQDLERMGFLTPEGVITLQERHYRTLKFSEDLEYYDRVSKAGHDLHAEKVPVVTTIHGSKGRQAERVLVFSEMSKRCWADRDTEHRLAYVAATRTQTDVTVCGEDGVDWANDHYDYPPVEAVNA
jgi:superfamily I DNA/RNA helicase